MKVTDKITITNEDNMLLMARYPDNYFDLAVVDPPYGIGESGKNHKSRNTLVRQKDGVSMRRCPSTNYTQKDWDDKPAGEDYFNELKRVSNNQIVFGSNYFKELMQVCKSPRRIYYDEFIKRNPNGVIIWDKVNGTNDFNDCEIIWTSFDFPTYVIKYMWAGMMQGVSVVSGTRMQGNKQLNDKRIHPTQKPVKLFDWLLLNYTKPHFKILGGHSGSGTQAISYHNIISYWESFGQCTDESELVDCELDKEYYDKSIQRIRKHTAQQNLFAS